MYDKKYTLCVPFNDGVHDILNGRIFKIKKNEDDNHMAFFDAFSNEPLLTSTSIINRNDQEGGFVTITTESGTVYYLRRISFLLPTTISLPTTEVTETPEDKPAESKFNVIKETTDTKHINYCDGWFQRTFEFDRELTEDEFKEFCTERGLALEPKGAWYMNWNTVHGGGKEWTWRENHPYKD